MARRVKKFRLDDPGKGPEAGFGVSGWGGPGGPPEVGLPPEEKKEHKHKIIPPDLEKYREGAREFVDRYKELFFTIAGDRSLDFRVGNGFYIDLKEGVIYLDIKDWEWKEKLGVTDWQLLWSVCHELSHYRDLREDPEGMLQNFEHMWKRAEELAPRALEIIKRKFPGGELPKYVTRQVKIDSKGNTKPWVEVFLYRKLHLLYNSLDDMFVNQPLGARSRVFAPGASKAGEVERLYRDYLFPTDPNRCGAPPEAEQAADYLVMPKSYQLAYYFLRRKMVPGQEILVSDRVKKIMETAHDEDAASLGLTLEKEVQKMTDLANMRARVPSWRYEQIRLGVEPIFMDLLFRDLEEQPIPPPGQGVGKGEEDGEGEDGEEKGTKGKNEGKSKSKSPWDELDDKPEPIDKEAVEQFLEDMKKKEKEDRREKRVRERKDRLTPDERSKLSQKETDRRIAKRYSVDPRFAEEYRMIEHDIRQYKEDLARIFEQIMRSIEERIRAYWEEGFRSGRFNVERFIRKYGPDLAAGGEVIPWDALDVFDRHEFESRISLFPKKITVRLVLDGSASMSTERLLALKQLSVLLLEGLSTFQETINLRFKLKEPFRVDTEIVMFGSAGASQVVKTLTGDKMRPEDELADRFRAFGKITSNYGATCDAEPLWKISAQIDAKYEEELKEGAAREFVFVVTDGGSNDVSQEGRLLVNGLPNAIEVDYSDEEIQEQKVSIDYPAAQDTRNAAEALQKKGVAVRGLQIGQADVRDRATFLKVWGDYGERIPHPKDLAPAVGRLLAEELASIKFETRFEDEDLEEEDEI